MTELKDGSNANLVRRADVAVDKQAAAVERINHAMQLRAMQADRVVERLAAVFHEIEELNRDPYARDAEEGIRAFHAERYVVTDSLKEQRNRL